jgi:hypothetical protein
LNGFLVHALHTFTDLYATGCIVGLFALFVKVKRERDSAICMIWRERAWNGNGRCESGLNEFFRENRGWIRFSNAITRGWPHNKIICKELKRRVVSGKLLFGKDKLRKGAHMKPETTHTENDITFSQHLYIALELSDTQWTCTMLQTFFSPS